jgi:hypothetical protein
MAFHYSQRFLRRNPTFPQSAKEMYVCTSMFRCPVGIPFADGDIIWMDMIPYGCIHVAHLISFGSRYSLDTTGTANPVEDDANPWDATVVFPDVEPILRGYAWQEANAIDPTVDRKWKDYQCLGIEISGAGGAPEQASGYILRLVFRYKNFEMFRRGGYDMRVQPDMSTLTPPPYV